MVVGALFSLEVVVGVVLFCVMIYCSSVMQRAAIVLDGESFFPLGISSE